MIPLVLELQVVAAPHSAERRYLSQIQILTLRRLLQPARLAAFLPLAQALYFVPFEAQSLQNQNQPPSHRLTDSHQQ